MEEEQLGFGSLDHLHLLVARLRIIDLVGNGVGRHCDQDQFDEVHDRDINLGEKYYIE